MCRRYEYINIQTIICRLFHFADIHNLGSSEEDICWVCFEQTVGARLIVLLSARKCHVHETINGFEPALVEHAGVQFDIDILPDDSGEELRGNCRFRFWHE